MEPFRKGDSTMSRKGIFGILRLYNRNMTDYSPSSGWWQWHEVPVVVWYRHCGGGLPAIRSRSDRCIAAVLYHLVNVYKKPWEIIIFSGKTHYFNGHVQVRKLLTSPEGRGVPLQMFIIRKMSYPLFGWIFCADLLCHFETNTFRLSFSSIYVGWIKHQCDVVLFVKTQSLLVKPHFFQNQPCLLVKPLKIRGHFRNRFIGGIYHNI